MGISTELGWYTGEDFRLFRLKILEVTDNSTTIVSIQILFFVASVWIDN